MNLFNNQKGFSALEVILLVVVVGLLVGGGVYIYDHNSAPEKTTAYPKTTFSVSTKPTKTDDQLLTEALTKYCADATGSADATAEYTNKESEGAFFKANTTCTVPGHDGVPGTETYLKKENGGMTYLFSSQQIPGSADGKKYGLPSDWYSTDY